MPVENGSFPVDQESAEGTSALIVHSEPDFDVVAELRSVSFILTNYGFLMDRNHIKNLRHFEFGLWSTMVAEGRRDEADEILGRKPI